MKGEIKKQVSLKKTPVIKQELAVSCTSNPKTQSLEIHEKELNQACIVKRQYFFAALVMGCFQLFSAINTMFQMLKKGQSIFIIAVVIFAFSVGFVLSMSYLTKEFLKALKKERDAIRLIKEQQRVLL